MEKNNNINIEREDMEFIVKITNMSKKEKILLEGIYDEDDWQQCCEDYIESIEYKSKKSYIAKVSNNGVVKGKHKGKTTIIVTVYFKSGAKKESKVRVQVRN